MGQYRIRKAGPGETPGYYSKHQLGLKRFAEGGAQEDNSMDLAQLLPQISNTIANAIMQSEDPENTDIRPIMAQMSIKLRESGVEPSAIESLVSAAGRQALQSVANMLDQQNSNEEETPAEQSTEVSEEPSVEEAPMNYGYYDQSAATQGGEDDQVVDELLMKYGGTNGKRKFIKETMNYLSKAAAGMEQQKQNTASLRGTENDMQGTNLTSKDTFVPAVKQIAQNKVDREFAEQQYNSMMNQEFQFGGSNRRIRRANRAMFGTPFAPPGVNTDYDFGFFGGLRSANVSWDPRMMQGMFGMSSIMPGMISGYNGGWYSPKYQIKGTRVKSSSETPSAINAKIENKEALDKVSKDTPNSEATSANRTIEQMRADALKYGNIEYDNGSAGWSAGTANSELNQGTNGNGRSGGNNAGSSNRRTVPNPVRTTTPTVPPVVTPKPKVPKYDEKKDYDYYEYSPFDTNTNDTEIPDNVRYRFNKVTKKWEKQMPSSGKWLTLTDPNGSRTKKLNNFVKTGNANFRPVYYTSPQEQRENAQRLMTLPMAAQADDALITNIALGFMPNPFSGASAVSKFGTKLLGAGESAGAKAIEAGGKGILNRGQSMLNSGQRMLNQGQGMLNPGQRMLNPPAGYQYTLGFEEGGTISPELYKYVYGGDDFSQEDLNYTNSKDTSDAYFRDGGLYHFQGTGDSQVSQTNTTQPGSGLTREDVEKMFEAYSKKMQMQQNPYGQQSYVPGSFGSAGYGQPMWGRPMYGQGYTGMMGQYGNMFSPFRKDFKYLTPYGQGNNNIAINPMSIMAGSMANIQKSGMVPTKFSYGKERKQDGKWFERKLGFNKDRVWTIDYSKPNAGQPQAEASASTIANPSSPTKPETIEDPKLRYMHESLTAPSNSRMPVGFPENTAGPRNTEFAYGGYLDEYQIAGEINNQVNPMNSNIPTDMKIAEKINELDNCSEEDKMNPNSPCYEKQTEQLKFKEETARTYDPFALKNIGVFAGRLGTNTATQVQDYNNTYVPGMQEFIYGRGKGQQRTNTGPYEENTGARNYTGFQGVVKKGGSTGLKENGEYQLTMDEISEILKAGGKIEFL